MKIQSIAIIPLLVFLFFTSMAGSALADNVTGTCAGDSELAKRMVTLRNGGKNQDDALIILKLRGNRKAEKFSELIWTNDELLAMKPNAVGRLILEKCTEVNVSTAKQTKILPLSCNVKSKLAEATALARDAGKTREEMYAFMTRPSSELSKKEVNAILDVSFGGMKTVPPEKIGAVIYKLCVDLGR